MGRASGVSEFFCYVSIFFFGGGEGVGMGEARARVGDFLLLSIQI